ncbi:hypothetical protein VTH06DRAFT_3044 [Thermothelomyces fergusii]
MWPRLRYVTPCNFSTSPVIAFLSYTADIIKNIMARSSRPPLPDAPNRTAFLRAGGTKKNPRETDKRHKKPPSLALVCRPTQRPKIMKYSPSYSLCFKFGLYRPQPFSLFLLSAPPLKGRANCLFMCVPDPFPPEETRLQTPPSPIVWCGG